MLALICVGADKVYGGNPITDPLRAMGAVSNTPAKEVIRGTNDTCALSVHIPSPLALPDAVEYALCKNPKTRQAWAQVKADAAAFGIGRAGYLPTLNASGNDGKINKATSFPG